MKLGSNINMRYDNPMSEFYIGLMSGTSMDGIDAVLVDFSNGVTLLDHHLEKMPESLITTLRRLSVPGDNEIETMGVADVLVGKAFATAVNTLLAKANIESQKIIAIGSHGQTIRHRPRNRVPFTLQIGDPNVIAVETGITTVADFRRKDMALGGDGAPLVPAFHQYIMAKQSPCVILNIGGIANVTLLNNNTALGFDTGPGNCLMDAWIRLHHDKSHDKNGDWAKTGTVLPELLQRLLHDPYFALKPPKSTGTEYFNLNWIENFTQNLKIPPNPADIQATLLELTAQSITLAIKQCAYDDKPLYVCGGGVHNQGLMQRLSELHNGKIKSTQMLGIDPDWLEAIAFAWFAKNTLAKQSSNLPSVTGATRSAVLGGIYYS